MIVNRPHLKAFPAAAAAAPHLGVPAEATIIKAAMRGLGPTAFAEQEGRLRWLRRRVAGWKCRPASPRPEDDPAKPCRAAPQHRPAGCIGRSSSRVSTLGPLRYCRNLPVLTP